MAGQLATDEQTEKDAGITDILQRIRKQRLMQISGVTAFGLLMALLVARNVTFYIFFSGFSCLLAAFFLSFRGRLSASAYVLIGSMSAMLFALAMTGAGLFDLAILGYPGILIFAAILGGVNVFASVLLFVIGQCVTLAFLTLEGIITPYSPTLSWVHLVFILVIFVITGFSVYILVQDIKRLMTSLQDENQKVQRSREKIQYLAHHDPLTNLPNRLFGEKLFDQSILTSQSSQHGLALLFIDLDNFKPVNDALGHAAGDELLQQLTISLREKLPPKHHILRFGGDEFIVLAPIINGQQQLEELAKSLIQKCASTFEILENQLVVSASIGIACAPAHGSDFKQLCRKADIAMYKAKQEGRNTFRFYDVSMDKQSEEKFQLLQKLRPAIAKQQFEIYYQPLVNLQTHQVCTIEALIRWPQPNGTLIGPNVFIPIAENSGLINQLGSWVLHKACQFGASQRTAGYAELKVAVNISAVQFKNGELLNTVSSALNQSGLPASALELEITESLLLDDGDQIQLQLSQLSALGVTIVIDDFGTGYSNLGYFSKLNASTLKIDRSFVHSMCRIDHDASLVIAIINIAKSLGLRTVAEGIEDKETLDKLIELGCDMGQGFYWSPPISTTALKSYLAQRSEVCE